MIYNLAFNIFVLAWLKTQIRERMSGSDLYVFTLKFLALKKGFSPIKNTFQMFFDFCLPLFYATFQCGRFSVFKKIVKKFLTPKK